MVKHTQTIRRQKPANSLSVFDHFVGLALKVLNISLLLFTIFNILVLDFKYRSAYRKIMLL